MMIKIAFRNIFRQKRRTILTVLTMLGGFTLSAVSIGWSDGSYNNIIDLFTRNQLGHIQIHTQGYLDKPTLYKTIHDYDKIENQVLSVPGVQSCAPRVFSAGLASVGDKSAGVKIIGVDPRLENTATRLDKKVIEGKSLSMTPQHEILLGKGLAQVLHAKIGDEVVILSQGADGSIANDLYIATGFIESSDKMSDQISLYLHVSDAQELLVLDGQVHEIAVIGTDLGDIPELALEIRAAINRQDLAVETWKEFANTFYQAMQADQQGMWVMLFVIVLVVAVGVLNTVLMTVLERTREYGLLRAVGTSPSQVFRLVLAEVFFMSIIGVIIGSGLSYIANDILSTHGISLGQSFTFGGVEFTTMYGENNARCFYIPALCIVISATLISIFPALKAAHIAPVKAMRTH
ncbi:MAG: FtsX-like permease family protein [Candidatus Zixiibacteriota bacterium]